jgi:sigma-E factor negative regulatory protein RseB
MILFGLFISLSVQANSDQVAKQLLERMIQAVNNLSYQGTFIHLHDNQLETMKIMHDFKDGKLQERLVSLNGAPREVIRDHTSVTCVMPDAQDISVDKRPLSSQFLASLPDDLDRLDTYYTFKLLGKGRVAGRNSKVVAIIPRDGYRYGYRFFVDDDSALPLKSDLMDERGKAVEQTMFTHLEVGVTRKEQLVKDLSDTPNAIELKGDTNNVQTIERPEGPNWIFQDLPAGFSINTRNVLTDPHGDEPIHQYVLTDGLASLSVFIETVGQSEALHGVSRLGAINAWGGQREGYQVTAVGEVPAITLLDVVDAMRLKR